MVPDLGEGEAHREHHEDPAGHAGQHREGGQRRHQQGPGEDPLHHEEPHGLEPHRRQGVELLVDLHGADLGGEGGAGAPRKNDRREDGAEFADHDDTDDVRGVGLGAEHRQRLRRLERDDDARQE